MKLKCFIACAYGRPDVEKLYDLAIKRVLRELEIQAIRVDRVIHNDDIPQKIGDLISEADFCISDLTYARPSVYFEAGLATGKGKPVVYTCREDHFSPKEGDKEGNLKIHFDVITKNYVKWTKPNDYFRQNLKNRIRGVIRPLLRNQQKQTKQSIALQEFQQLTIPEKRRKILHLAKRFLRSRGYRPNREDSFHADSEQWLQLQHFDSAPNRRIQLLFAHSLSDLFKLNDPLRSKWHDLMNFRNSSKYGRFDTLFAICLFGRVSALRIDKLLPEYEYTSNHRLMYTSEGKNKEQRNYLAILDGITSSDQFKMNFCKLFLEWEKLISS